MALHDLFATTEGERLRQVENEQLVRPAAQRHLLMCVLVMVAVVLTEPRHVIVAGAVTVGLAAVVVGLVQLGLSKTSNVGEWMAVENVVICTTIGVATAVTGGLDSPVIPVFCVLAAFIGIRFKGLVSQLLLGYLVACAVAGVLAADAAGALDRAGLFTSWLAACVAVWMATTAVGHSERRARSDAVSDTLTGLLNRKAFDLRMDVLQHQAARGRLPVAILMCDLDGFKAINDTLGHEQGDDVLRRVADSLRASARTTDRVYRVGGDEFAVVLDGASAEDAAEIGERLREGVERAFPGVPRVTLSVGVATGRGAHLHLHEVVRDADRALYEAKRGGRNAVVAAAVA